MGCTASKATATTVITEKSHQENHPMRTFSVTTPLVHHPPTKKGDTHHLVSLTSTTYGYASLLSEPPPPATTTARRTEQRTLSPDSVINTWELMQGLGDDHEGLDCHDCYSSSSKKQPLWKYLSEESLLSKMDPSVASAYRRALSSSSRRKHSKTGSTSNSNSNSSSSPSPAVVVYTTSLRGVRKTYEDCREVRSLLSELGVGVDERDVSMDSELRKELQISAGGALPLALPQVFVRGRRVGGAEEVRRMHETGRLAELLRGVPRAETGFVCGLCGNVRFVMCSVCCGSRKVFLEEEGAVRRCWRCNENGLIRCPACCSANQN